MKYVGILLSLLGIGLHLRMMEFLLDPDLSASFRLQWNVAPIENKLLLVGAAILPFAFYGTCVAACVAKRRTWKLTAAALSTGALAFYYFTEMSIPSSIAKTSMWAAFFSYIPYSVKPRCAVVESEAVTEKPDV